MSFFENTSMIELPQLLESQAHPWYFDAWGRYLVLHVIFWNYVYETNYISDWVTPITWISGSSLIKEVILLPIEHNYLQRSSLQSLSWWAIYLDFKNNC